MCFVYTTTRCCAMRRQGHYHTITIEIIILPMYCIQAKLRHDMYWFQLILRNRLYDYFASQHKLRLAETWIIKCIQFTT